MIAYHGDPTIKAAAIATMQKHRREERLLQHYGYWEGGKGCAVGCLLHSRNHAEYEPRFGIPATIAHLEDAIFEGLPADKAQAWPERFLEAIPVGADLSLLTARFFVWLLADDGYNVGQWARPDGKTAIATVRNLYQCILDGGTVTDGEWNAAADAAADAAAYAAARAAYAAAYAADAAARAADAAAYAAAYAAYAAAYAADAAARAAYAAARAADAADAAADAAYKQMADKLLALLADAPVPEAVPA